MANKPKRLSSEPACQPSGRFIFSCIAIEDLDSMSSVTQRLHDRGEALAYAVARVATRFASNVENIQGKI